MRGFFAPLSKPLRAAGHLATLYWLCIIAAGVLGIGGGIYDRVLFVVALLVLCVGGLGLIRSFREEEGAIAQPGAPLPTKAAAFETRQMSDLERRALLQRLRAHLKLADKIVTNLDWQETADFAASRRNELVEMQKATTQKWVDEVLVLLRGQPALYSDHFEKPSALKPHTISMSGSPESVLRSVVRSHMERLEDVIGWIE